MGLVTNAHMGKPGSELSLPAKNMTGLTCDAGISYLLIVMTSELSELGHLLFLLLDI